MSGTEKPMVTRFSFPRAEVTLSHTDWQIVKVIWNDPRKSTSEIAGEVGVMTRTVKRRLTKLTKAKAFYLIGVPDFRKSTGVSCNFLVFCPDERKKQAVDKMILSKFERIGFSYTSAPEGSISLCEVRRAKKGTIGSPE